MGAWGVALYSDDYAMDVRADYRDALKFGKTDEEALEEVFNKDLPPAGSEDEYVFWYALADTMWNYGRLTPEVKEKALYFLETVTEDDRWDSEKTWERRKQVLSKLKEKLLSEQPERKRVAKYPEYRCPWNMGDVFAYRFHSKYSEEYGMRDKYIAFRKITETLLWPNNIVPVVQIYRWMGDQVPGLDELRDMPVLLLNNLWYAEEWTRHLIDLYIRSNRDLKAQNYQYIGNIQDDQLIEPSDKTYNTTFEGKATKLFEKIFIDRYTVMKDGICVFRDDV